DAGNTEGGKKRKQKRNAESADHELKDEGDLLLLWGRSNSKSFGSQRLSATLIYQLSYAMRSRSRGFKVFEFLGLWIFLFSYPEISAPSTSGRELKRLLPLPFVYRYCAIY